VLSAAYLFTVGYGLPTFADVNLPAPTSRTYEVIGGDFNGQTLTVSPFFDGPRPDPRFGIITANRSLIKSKYHAVAVQLNRRLTRGLQFESSYTLSKATDNGQSSSIFPGSNYPSNPFDLSADHGPSDFDARHKFTATAVWSSASRWSNHRLAHAILKGFTASMVFFAKSGAPHSAGVGGSPAGGLRAAYRGGGAQSQCVSRSSPQRLPAAEDRQCGSPGLATVSDNAQGEPGILGEKRSIFSTARRSPN
jgi:hypothetical protein